jgi:PAS domain S-box-containing protein
MEKGQNIETDQRSTTLESRLRLVIDTIPEQVWSALPDGSVDFVNRRWQEYAGLSLEEGLGWGARATVHPEDLSMLMDDWRRAVVSGKPFEKEARFRRADGEYRWFLVRAVPLRDELGYDVYSRFVRLHWKISLLNRRQRKQRRRNSPLLRLDC